MALLSYRRPLRMLAAIAQGLADHRGVTDALIDEARRVGADELVDRDALPGVAARAWRWVPEAVEAGLSLEEAGLPSEYADITAKLFELYTQDKDRWDISATEMIERLTSE